MANGLQRPLVPGASGIGEVIARATAAATAQSAQILSTARSIAADRQRAGEQAADAVVRMRLEDFQREQFRQKKSVEDARLGIALSANRRAEERAPLEMGLLQAEIDQAPLRTALIGAQITGAQFGNMFDATKLMEFPEDLRRARRRDDLEFSHAGLEHKAAEKEFNDLSTAESEVRTLSSLMTETDLSNPDELSYGLNLLNGMKEMGTVTNNPQVAELYNQVVEKLAPTDDVRERLMIPEAVIEATRPETTMGLRRTVENRQQLNNALDATIASADARIKIKKSELKELKDNNKPAAKEAKAQLEREIRGIEEEKSKAQEDYIKALKRLETSTGFLQDGPQEIDPVLIERKRAEDFLDDVR